MYITMGKPALIWLRLSLLIIAPPRGWRNPLEKTHAYGADWIKYQRERMVCLQPYSMWPVLPMEPMKRAEPFDDPETLFQVKWDGVRVLAYAYPEGIRLFNRRLHERTAQYPEIAEALAGLKPGTALDGEIVALDAAGKPDFPRVLRRDFARAGANIGPLTRSVPVHYMVFDVLWLAGEELLPWPLSERQEALKALALPPPVHKVESTAGEGKALFAAVKAEGLEGIVAKKAASPYLIGQKTELWQKIKCFRTVTALVGGYLTEGVRVRSLLVGLPEPEGLTYIGAAASGVTQQQWSLLREIFTGMAAPCPFVRAPTAAGVHWVRPEIKAEVRFLEYTSEGVMRAPSVLRFL